MGESKADYVVHAKLKNNNLWSRIYPRWPTVACFCKENDLCQSMVGALLNLKIPAVNADGGWKKIALELADALSCEPEDLFVDEQQTARLATNEAFIEMTRQQALSMADHSLKIEADEIRNLLFENERLTPRQKTVLKLRFEDDMTMREIGEKLGTSAERVRQIEARALRELRKPGVLKHLGVSFD